MKTSLLLSAVAMCAVASAAPSGLATGIPAFLDTDGNGIISEAERQAFVESRKQARSSEVPDWDSNDDGVVDAEERAAAVAALRARMEEKRAQLFANLAGDDGILTLDEFSSLPPFAHVPPATVENLFNLLDANGDDQVTLEEFLIGVGRSANGGPPSPPAGP